MKYSNIFQTIKLKNVIKIINKLNIILKLLRALKFHAIKSTYLHSPQLLCWYHKLFDRNRDG